MPIANEVTQFKSWTTIVVEKLEHWCITFIAMLPNIVLAAIIFTAFVFAARFARRFLGKILSRATQHSSVSNLFAALAYMLILSIGLFTALSILQLNKAVSSLLAGAGIIGLALGFAFQDLTANFISGIFMVFKRPFEVGDILETNDCKGHVEEIQLRTTTIYTYDGLHVTIPNKDIFQKLFINHTKSDQRRIEFAFNIPHIQDLDKVLEKTRVTLENFSFLSKDKIHVRYSEIGDTTVKLNIWFWVSQNGNPKYLDAKNQAILAIIQTYKQEGIIVVPST
jgi:small-conductance mechanosensitive channel